MYHTIDCDLDGIVANFHLEAVRAHIRVGRRFPTLNHHGTPLELSWEHLRSRWPKGVSCQTFCCDIGEVADYWEDPRMEEFWHPLRIDPFFWSNMPAFPWVKELIDLLASNCKHLIFVTTPDTSYTSYSGKYQWLCRNKLHNFQVVMIKHKWRLANPEDLLIDDYHVHVESWKKECLKRYGREGEAILFPQPWNLNHPYSNDPVGFVRRYLATRDEERNS